MTISAPATPRAIPLPPGFPVHFEPGEEQLLWEHDRSHFPAQVTPLEGQWITDAIAHGIGHGLRRYDVPVAGVKVRIVNGYMYQAFVPTDASPEEIEEQSRRSEARTAEVVGRLRDRWEDEWRPEIVDHLLAMEAVDPRAVTTAELADLVDEYRRHLLRLWEIHFEIVFPAYIAVSEFEDFHRDLFGGDPSDAYRLLHGFQSKTFEVGRDLWRLSRVALASPEVAEALAVEAAADVPAALRRSAAGRAFLAEVDAHLVAYGHRTATWGLATPSFIEDPTPVMKVLKDYAAQPDGGDPGRRLGQHAAEREAAVADARERLQGYPAPVVAQFEAMLEAAQVGLVLTEDHGFYIDAYATSLARELISEIGRRLAEDRVLEDPEDALMLTYDDLRNALRRSGPSPRFLVGARRAALAQYAHVTPPPRMGTMPAGPPPDSPLTRLVAKSAGVPAPSGDPDVLRGTPASSGAVTGVARVVRSLADADRLRPGQILVAETTAPPWTPLFAVAAAVVTDTGGPLSHSAVVAREYAIPAVVGAVTATTIIDDGDVVEVDGDAGTIRLVR